MKMSKLMRISKIIAMLSLIIFVSAFGVAISKGSSNDLSITMVIISWFGWIISLIIRVFTPEEKARLKITNARYAQRCKEREAKREKEECQTTPMAEEHITHTKKEPNLLLIGGIGSLISLPIMVILGLAKKYK